MIYMKAVLKILRNILIAVLVIFLGIVTINAIALYQYSDRTENAFLMPATDDRALAMQGICYDYDTKLFFLVGYRSDDTAGSIYAVDSQTKETVKHVYLANEDGTPFVNHDGGIAVNGDYLYVAGSVNDCFFVFNKQDVLDAKNDSSIKLAGRFETALSPEDGIKPSFISISDGKVYTGEFSSPIPLSIFKLRDNHKIGSNHAILTAFPLDENGTFGIGEKPVMAVSIPHGMQGCFMEGDDLYLSKSIAAIPPALYKTTLKQDGTYTLMGASVPLYQIDTKETVGAVFSQECIQLLDEKMYVITEAPHYIGEFLAHLLGLDWCKAVRLN